jgi:hypothetical protein
LNEIHIYIYYVSCIKKVWDEIYFEIVEILVDFCVICYSVKRRKKYKPQQVVVSTLEGTNNFLQDETGQFNTIRL